jgi:eukaryotic-like serine/threonine-protein kinase
VVSDTTNGSRLDAKFKLGDVIGGEYVICKLVGRGGFGEVYLALYSDGQSLCALKTIRSDLLPHPASREAFKKEALLWVNLEEHPFIVAARVVHEFSRRLFVNMDYIAPDANGRVSLADHLACTSGPLDPDDSLKWAIQFCYGMEHAFQRGIKCHRDIKPSNILIRRDGTLQISDFGLALAAEMSWKQESGPVVTKNREGGAGLSLLVTDGKRICGTPGYIAPELLLGGGADVRSDIYSFGLVLWQMAKGSRAPPFRVPYDKAANIDDYLQRVLEQQIKGRIPYAGEAMQSVIERCLAPEPSQRYESFKELRLELEQVLFRRAGRTVELPKGADRNSGFWTFKGMSLDELGRREDAIVCFDKVIELDRHYVCAWSAKGNVLVALGRHDEAVDCYTVALQIDAQRAAIWDNKGSALRSLGRYEEALECHAKALEIDPGYGAAWFNKGSVYSLRDWHEEAAACYNRALEINPLHTDAWECKGNALRKLRRFEEAVDCFNTSLQQAPQNLRMLRAKGLCLKALGRLDEALSCIEQALEVSPGGFVLWDNKGTVLRALGRYEEALACYAKALEFNPQNPYYWGHSVRRGYRVF